MFTFDRFEPGALLGEESWTFDQAAFDEWVLLFPDDARLAPKMPPGMVAVAGQRAFMTIFADRPAGNIHASQVYRLRLLPELGEEIVTELRCASREMRKSRRWVTIGSSSRNSRGDELFAGEMTLIWAA